MPDGTPFLKIKEHAEPRRSPISSRARRRRWRSRPRSRERCAARAPTATPDSCSSSIRRFPPQISASRSRCDDNACDAGRRHHRAGQGDFRDNQQPRRSDSPSASCSCRPGVDRPPPLHFAPFLSGKRLLTTQTFRDLFRSEVIGSEGIGVKDIALLFTDLKGSTALYDRIGDLNAFSLVQQHFEQLQSVTARHHGAIIKTIGDAIMAAFVDPADAVEAALDMRSEIARSTSGSRTRSWS